MGSRVRVSSGPHRTESLSEMRGFFISIGIIAGYNGYSGDLGNSFFSFDQSFYGHVGGELRIRLNDNLSLMGNYVRGEIGYLEYDKPSFTGGHDGGKLLLKYRFMEEEDFVRPYVVIGPGGYQYYGDKIANSLNWTGNGGVGVDFNLSERWVADLRIVGSYNFSDDVNEDNPPDFGVKSGDWVFYATAGLRFQFGFGKDSDGDGVKDQKDECPDTPGLIELNGCPDTDKDGIADKDDQCPTQAGLAEFQGCPDTDGDSIPDPSDECPTEAGLAVFNGCPDMDNDSVPDVRDDCPEVPGPVEFNGCPDTDGDTVLDTLDRCPTVPGVVALRGCPDKDGDGIADIDDRCPDVAGIPENKGCPEVKVEHVQIFTKALTGITFFASSDKIKSSSYDVLDDIVDIMKANPHYKLYIAGYASSDGDDDMNLKLSKDRAASVRKYIESKGVESSRLRSDGFGEANPIADNSTPAGRAKNRRVEFTVEF
jgi:OOP family OmpA-OmpF porin